MLWIKNHQPLSLLLFSVSAFFLFFLLGPSLSCSAASQSFDFTSNPGRNTVLFDSSNNSLGFTPVYLTVENIDSGSCQIMSLYNLIQIQLLQNISNAFSPAQASDCSFYLSASLPSGFIDLKFMSYSFPTGGFRLTLYDSVPGSSCPTCPEIPETPYGDKLDKIYNAIMIGSATLLVIYFFFAIYSMFFGGLKK